MLNFYILVFEVLYRTWFFAGIVNVLYVYFKKYFGSGYSLDIEDYLLLISMFLLGWVGFVINFIIIVINRLR